MKNFYNWKMTILLCMGLFVSLLVACSDASDGGDSDSNNNDVDSDESLSIEVVSKGFQHDFWRAVRTGADTAADEYGASMNFVGPKDELAIAEQVEMINNAVNKKPS